MTRYPCDMAPVLAALGYETRVCLECGTPFTEPHFRHGNGRFCSPACRTVSYTREYYGKGKQLRAPLGARGMEGVMLDEERVWSMHCRGKTASEIDEAMKLEPGTARRVIAGKWADAAPKRTETRPATAGSPSSPGAGA